jgi:hypothetical protein
MDRNNTNTKNSTRGRRLPPSGTALEFSCLLYLRSLYKLTSFYHVSIISDIFATLLFRNIFFIFT